MRPVVLSLVGLVVLAGCAGPEDEVVSPPDGGDPLPSLPQTAGVFHRAGATPALFDAARLAVGGQFHIGADATEPTLGVTREGSIFITAFGAGTISEATRSDYPYPTVLRSTDKGQTWTDVGPRLPNNERSHPNTNDPMLIVDPDTGRIFTDDLTPPCSQLSFSDNNGQSWTTNFVACGTPAINDHQTIAVAKPRLLPTIGYSKLVYFCANNIAAWTCATSQNGGLTFNPQVPVFAGVNPETLAFCGSLTGHIKADYEGRVFLPRTCSDVDGETKILVAMSDNDGLTWTVNVIDGEYSADDGDPSVAVDEANNVYATWTDNQHVWLTVSKDHATTWSSPVDVVAPSVTATYLGVVAAGAQGRVAVAYVGSTIPKGYEGKPPGPAGLYGDIACTFDVEDCDPPEWANATWNGYISIIEGADGPDPLLQTVTANDPDDPLARGLCGQTRCHGMNDFIDIVIDGEGRPWAAFVDVCTKGCVTDPDKHYDQSIGLVGTILSGPSLRGAADALLPEIAPQPQSPPA